MEFPRCGAVEYLEFDLHTASLFSLKIILNQICRGNIIKEIDLFIFKMCPTKFWFPFYL